MCSNRQHKIYSKTVSNLSLWLPTKTNLQAIIITSLSKHTQHARFTVLQTAFTKVHISWDVTLCQRLKVPDSSVLILQKA